MDSPHPFQRVIERNNRIKNDEPGLPPNAAVPDNELVANLIFHGQPRWSAEQLRNNPQLRLAATKFLFDCEDSARGDKRAKERIDFVKAQWERMRQEQLMADDPSRIHRDVIIDPRTLL